MSLPLPNPNRNAPTKFASAPYLAMADRSPKEGAAGALGTAVGRLAQSAAQVETGLRRIEGDRTLNDAAKLVRKAQFAKATLEPAHAEFRQAMSMALAARVHLLGVVYAPFDMDKRPDGTPRSMAEVLLAQEIRAHFASLPRTERLNNLQRAIDANDMKTLIAVTSAPPYLSGLNEALWHVAQHKVINQHAAKEHAALEALTQAESIATTAEKAMFQALADTIDFQTAAEFERSMAA
jgi:hypothetical protein